MKKLSILSILFSLCLPFQSIRTKPNQTSYISRDVTVDKNEIQLDSIIEKFDEGYKHYDENTNTMTVEIVDYVDLDNNDYIVNMSDNEILNEELLEFDKSKLSYKFVYNAETYNMDVELTYNQNNISEKEIISGLLFLH